MEIRAEERKYPIIASFEQAKNHLFYELSFSEKKLYANEKGIERTKELMRLLGNPQESVRTIHIAGTSGKGSVSYVLSSLLEASGHNVGLVVSPHVYDIRERMQINNCYISEDVFVQELNQLLPIINSMDKSRFGRPTYYEANLALAFNLFKKSNLDYVVLETGVGGLYDSTNVIKRQDKLSVITALGLDHTEILGNTVEEIAAQKAGIINPNSHAIVLDPGVSPKLVIEQIAKEKSADLDIVSANSYNYLGAESGGITFSIPGLGFEQNFHLPLYGEYQAQNATLAIRALQFLAGKDNFAIDNRIIQNGLNNVRIPARTEIRKVLNRQIIIDAAHNPQKIASFIDMLKEANTPNNAVIIFGTKKGKNFIDELKELNKYFKKIIITGFFNDEPSTIFKSEDPMLVARQADALGLKVLNVSKYPFDAFNYAIAETNENQPIIVTGSIYMIGELNSKL